MNKKEKLLKNTIIISIGKICTSFITFLLLPIYTGILSTEEYGVVDLVNTLIYLLVPLVTLQLEQAVFRNLIEARNNFEKQSEIISTGIIQLTVQVFSVLLLGCILYPFIQNNYKIFLIINLVSYIFVSFFLQIARGIGETKKYALGSFLSAVLIILFNIIFLIFFKLGAYGMLLGNFMGYIFTTVYLFFSLKLYKYLKLSKYKKTLLRALLRYSVPLVPNSLSWWIFNASDRLIVSSVLNVSQNGILSASLKFSTIITTLYNIFDTSWIESISVNIEEEDINVFFNQTFNMIFNFFASMCLVLIAFMPIIFPLMINHNYSSGYGLVPISIIASLFNVVQGMVVVVYAAKKDTKSIAKTSMAAALINIIVHLLLIKFIGLYAAVISTVVAFAVLAFYRLYGVNKNYFKVQFDRKILINILMIFTFVLIIYYLNNVYLNIISMLVSIIYAIYSNKEAIKYLSNMFLKKISNKQKRRD